MAKRSQSTLTAAQMEIMNLFWDHGELGVAEVWQALAENRRIARNTVQTMLRRLADKGWLVVRAEGNAFYYRALRSRRRVLAGKVRELLDTAFAGSAAGLVMTLLENRRISPQEADQIRTLIDRAEREEP